MKKILPVSVICFVIDQILKILIVNSFSVHEGLTVIPKFFSFMYVRNTGAAWSIFEGKSLFLALASIIALLVIYFLFIKEKELSRIEEILYGILIGGILGNLWDRIFRGYVIDYLSFIIFDYPFPIFNFADICIVLSVFGILILTFRGDKNDIKNRN